MMRKRYRCPACSRLFDYDHHPSVEADPLPGYCPYEDCNHEPSAFDPGLAAPHLATKTILKTVDNLHRDMERGAETRAEMAREQHGLSAAEVSGLKMTDMKDHMREGDISVAPVANEVTRAMAQLPAASVGFSQPDERMAQYSSFVRSGPYPNAGLRAMRAVKDQHQRATEKMTGVTGKSYTSERPALETKQPGYQQRI